MRGWIASLAKAKRFLEFGIGHFESGALDHDDLVAKTGIHEIE